MRALTLIFAVLFFSACAEPKYAVPQPALDPRPSQSLETCAVKLQGHCVQLQWRKVPTADEVGALTLIVASMDDRAMGLPKNKDLKGEVRVSLWMPSMNHGSTPTVVTQVGVGTYLVDEVYFIMPGDWEIRVQTYQDGQMTDQGVHAFVF